jgi:hypothetical protein
MQNMPLISKMRQPGAGQLAKIERDPNQQPANTTTNMSSSAPVITVSLRFDTPDDGPLEKFFRVNPRKMELMNLYHMFYFDSMKDYVSQSSIPSRFYLEVEGEGRVLDREARIHGGTLEQLRVQDGARIMIRPCIKIRLHELSTDITRKACVYPGAMFCMVIATFCRSIGMDHRAVECYFRKNDGKKVFIDRPWNIAINHINEYSNISSFSYDKVILVRPIRRR